MQRCVSLIAGSFSSAEDLAHGVNTNLLRGLITDASEFASRAEALGQNQLPGKKQVCG